MMLIAPDLCRVRDSEKDFVEKFSKISTQQKIEHMTHLLNIAHTHIERNANPKILFFDLSIQLGLTFKTNK
jgi:DNA polymerase-3 subunit delta'